MSFCPLKKKTQQNQKTKKTSLRFLFLNASAGPGLSVQNTLPKERGLLTIPMDKSRKKPKTFSMYKSGPDVGLRLT